MRFCFAELGGDIDRVRFQQRGENLRFLLTLKLDLFCFKLKKTCFLKFQELYDKTSFDLCKLKDAKWD